MRQRLLFLSRWFPYPPDNGAKQRIYHLLKELSTVFDISLITFFEEVGAAPEDWFSLREICQDVILVPYPYDRPSRLASLRGFLAREPRWVVERDSPEMRQAISKITAAQRFDLVLASQIDMAPYALAVNGCPRILEELEVSVLSESPGRETLPWMKLRRKMMVKKLRRYLAGLAPSFSLITTVSQNERDQIRKLVEDTVDIQVIPNGVDLRHNLTWFGEPVPDTMLYSGSLTYQANLDAMRYFVADIFDLIHAQRPTARLKITGKTHGVNLQPFTRNSSVRFTGYLPDIRPEVAQSWVSIVPLRVGGGTRLKILESLALGTPVISTSKGAEGLDLKPGHEILIADQPHEFARAVVQILDSPELRSELSRNGRQAVIDRYGWEPIGSRLASALLSLPANSGVAVYQGS